MLFPWTASDANGITRNPWNLSARPAARPAARRRRSRRDRGVRDRLRRRRLDPDPGGLLRAGRDEADARPDLDAARGEDWIGLSVYGALARTVTDSVCCST